MNFSLIQNIFITLLFILRNKYLNFKNINFLHYFVCVPRLRNGTEKMIKKLGTGTDGGTQEQKVVLVLSLNPFLILKSLMGFKLPEGVQINQVYNS